MAGAELIGKEEIKEVMDVLEDGRLCPLRLRQGTAGDLEGPGFREGLCEILRDEVRPGGDLGLVRPSRSPSRPSTWDPGTR